MLDTTSDLNSALAALAQKHPDLWTLSACGVTKSRQSIPVLLDQDAYTSATKRVRVLLIGGLSGASADSGLVLQVLEFAAREERLTPKVALSAVPWANLDAFTTESANVRDLSGGYPPQDNFYFDADAPESRYIWRWICLQSPDLLLEIRSGDSVRWESNDAVGFLPVTIGASKIVGANSLLGAIGQGRPDGIGPIPGLRLTVSEKELGLELGRLWESLLQVWSWDPSPARQELLDRRSRSNLETANILASAYGHRLETVVYTQGVAISGRLQLAGLMEDSANSIPVIASVVEDILSGERDPFEKPPSGSTLAGIIWAYDLARATGDQRASDLMLRAANYYQATSKGEAPTPADPAFRVEDMFYCGAMLGRAFEMTGDQEYLELMTNFLLDAGTQQENGLFWHDRSSPYFWGRGNGFAALGFTEAMTYLPDAHPKREAVLQIHLKHLAALRQIQQPTGMYWQIMDFPGSYQEFTGTCMIGYAMARGLRRGWLDSSYRDTVDLAWRGVKERIDDEGNVADACISTGVQQNINEYLDRTAIFGNDDRSGSLALWFAVEMERLDRGM
ncbi:MAG: glycoside hydrolase family 88 protein [Chloroflexi bacterium]|nr:glycoside hydrolase family 88 protein [Chloroflexota bacterium]MDA1219563.1 glycoside hydrolase family 88 protein [Chloroflexota bacterium]